MSSSARAFARRSRRGTPRRRSASSTLRRALSHGMSADSWNITAEPSAGVSMLSGRGLVEPGDQVQQRGLAASRCAEQADELAGSDVEVDPVEHERARAEALLHSFDAHRGSGGRDGRPDGCALVEARPQQVGHARSRRHLRGDTGSAERALSCQSSPSPAAETVSSPSADRMALSRRQVEQTRRSSRPSACRRPDRSRRASRRCRRAGRTRTTTCSSDRAMTSSDNGLPVSFSIAALMTPAASSGLSASHSTAATWPLEQVFDHIRVLVEEVGADQQHRGRELAVLPQVGLVHQHVRAGIDDQARHPGLRQPRAVDLAVLEQLQGLRVLGRRDGHVAARPSWWSRTPRRRARCAARRPACCRAAGWRASCPRGRTGSSIPSRTTRAAPPVVAPAITARGLAAGLDERVDRRVRADVGRVDRAGGQSLDRGGAGVEHLGRDVDSGQRVREETLLEPDERGRVGHVREVAELELADRGRAIRRGLGRARSPVRRRRRRSRPSSRPASPRVVIVVAVRILFTVSPPSVGSAVWWMCATGQSRMMPAASVAPSDGWMTRNEPPARFALYGSRGRSAARRRRARPMSFAVERVGRLVGEAHRGRTAIRSER